MIKLGANSRVYNLDAYEHTPRPIKKPNSLVVQNAFKAHKPSKA